ncbi:MAG: hypothetical protein ACYC69_00020 [Thermodesulfovibrionales bacterium]
MKTKLPVLLLILFALAPPAFGQLDLEQEVLIIPDTHNEKPYIWHVQVNPRGYELVMSDGPLKADKEQLYIFKILSPTGIPEGDVHVFITDDDLHVYAHRKAAWTGDDYRFAYQAPGPGKYRLEVVFKTPRGWINLRKNIKIDGPSELAADKIPGDEDYQVKIKLIPKKAYAEHVVTLLYEIHYRGAPVSNLEKMEDFDMQVAAWDEDLKEFIYMTPKQNFGGPEVAVSIVFMRPGNHAIFAEFKHNGYMRKIETVIDVLAEPRIDEHSIENIKPSE